MTSNMRRVAVTGLGAVCPLGADMPSSWRALKAGERGIRKPTLFSSGDTGIYAAAECLDFNADERMGKREQKRLDRFGIFSLCAAQEAVESSGLGRAGYEPWDVAVITGVGIGGFSSMYSEYDKMLEKGYRAVSPFLVPKAIANLAAGLISIKYGFKGPSYSVATACASGTDAIGAAFELIRSGRISAAVAGGAEAPLHPMGVVGFAQMHALSTNTDPETACRPFDINRDGFVLGEGAAYLALEDMERALSRGACIIAEIAGYGQTCDAYHMTAPHPEGEGAVRAMQGALSEAGIEPGDVGYINAHGTSTALNDECEAKAIKRVFKDKTPGVALSATKSMTGHMLGAAGAIEAAITALSLKEGFLPPTIGTVKPDPLVEFDLVLGKGRECEVEYALSNSFGFGGQNGCLLFKKHNG